VALLYASKSLENLSVPDEDQKAGVNIVRKAIQAPIRQILENSGVEASPVVHRLLQGKSSTAGFDAQKEEFVDMIDAGIIDPTKVVRTALQDAASVAGLLLTTEAMIAERPEPKKGGGMPGGMGGMGGMDMDM